MNGRLDIVIELIRQVHDDVGDSFVMASVLVVGSIAGAAESFIATFGRIQFVDWLELHVRVW